MFYSAIKDNDDDRQLLVFKTLLARAATLGFDVMNMVEVLNNKKVVTELNFKPGDGRLAHYLYNWRIPSLECDDVGIVLV